MERSDFKIHDSPDAADNVYHWIFEIRGDK